MSMRNINLSSLDLNLLPPLEALLRRRNVTHAAADVGLSQPAMSRALCPIARLTWRSALGAQPGRFRVDLAGARFAPRVTTALDELKVLFQEQSSTRASERRTIRVAASDTQTILRRQ